MAVAGDNTNKTIAIACVALMIFTVTYVMISADEESEADTVRYGVQDYYKISGQGSYTDSSFNGYTCIYVEGTSISNGAFKNCVSLTNVRLASTVKTIGESAFEGCTSLWYVAGSGVTSIGKCAFKNSSVGSIDFENSLTTIGENAFQGTSRLAYFPIWNTSVTEIKNGTFMNSGLQIIDLRSITSIGSTAFSGSKVDLQIVRSDQTALLPGVCRLYCDDDSLFSETGSPIRQVTKSGQTVTFILSGMTYLKVTAANDAEDLTEHLYNVPTYYATFKADGATDYTLSSRHMEVQLPEGVGLDALIELDSKDLPYKLPTGAAGKLTFNGWKIEGEDSFITEVTTALMRENGGRIVLAAEFGMADLTMDHSAISDRTEVSSLQTRAGFTIGGKYPQLQDVKGYAHVGWMVDGELLAPETEITKLESHTAISVWKPTITYDLTYLQSDGSVLKTVQVGYNETIAPDMSLAAAEEDGKRHIGWSADGKTAADNVRVEGNMSLKPVFEDRELFKVSVKDRGEALSVTEVYDGREYAFAQEDPFSPTQVFLGWTGGITSGTKVVVGTDITIESEWRDRAAYKVSFKDGRSVVATAEALEGIPFEITVDDPVREGKKFNGWYDESDHRYVKGDRLDVSANTELFTEWTDLAKYSVTVTDRGTVLESLEIYSGGSYTFSHEAPAAEGKVFVGWRCAGEEVSYGQVFAVDKPIAITAEWRLPYTFTIVFNDGIGGEKKLSVTEGSSIAIDFANPVSQESIFTGWMGSDGTVRIYGDEIAPAKSMTFDAQWRARESYTVTYMDGSDSVGTSEAKEGLGFAVDRDAGTKTGFRFIGWLHGDRTVSVGDVLDLDGAAVLTAVWEKLDVFSVKYVDGDVVLKESSGYDGDTVTIGLEHPEKEDFVFLTWEIGGRAVSDGQSVALSSDIVVEAAWRELDDFTVTFMDGEVIVKIGTCKEGDEFTITAEDPVSESKRFTKWTDGRSSYVHGDVLSPGGDIVLTAVWEDRKEFTVTFMDDGKAVSACNGYDGSEFTITVDDPIREGRAFAGWSLNGTTFAKGGSFVLTKDTNLEAVWSEKTHSITYYSEGAVMGVVKVVDGDECLIDMKLTRDGHAFKGWSLTDGGKVSKLNGDVLKPTADIALYAVWDDGSESRPSTDTTTDTDDKDKDDSSGADRDGDGSVLSSFGISGTTLAIATGVAAMVIALLAVAVRRS